MFDVFQEKPYVMVKDDTNLTGNARYEGFCIDMLKWIASQVGFQYAIRLVPDHKYGVYDPETKQWNGIVRELVDKVGTQVGFLNKIPGSVLSSTLPELSISD